MDHQSSLSILCLKDAGWQKAVAENRTVDEIFMPFVNQTSSLPGDEIIINAPMRNVDPIYDLMDIVPASLHLDDTEIELTASHQGNPIQSEWNKLTLMCRWIEETGIDDDYDCIIFDCPPATKIVSQNAIATSHGYIIPVVPEAVMERGAPHLYEMMKSRIDARLKVFSLRGEQRLAYVPETKLVGLVVTRIQIARGGYTIDHRQHLSSMERHWGDMLIGPYIPQGTGVSQSLADGVPVYNRVRDPNIGKREIEQYFYELLNNIIGRINSL